VALAVLALLTWRQEAIYKDEVTLWHATLATNPNVFIAQNNGGLLLTQDAWTTPSRTSGRRS
jgi:hypothetical protein